MDRFEYNSPMDVYSTVSGGELYQPHGEQHSYAFAENFHELGNGRQHFNPNQSETSRDQANTNQNNFYADRNVYNKTTEEPQHYRAQYPEWMNGTKNRAEEEHTPNGRHYKHFYSHDPYDGLLPSGPPPVYTTDPPAGLPTVRYNSLPRQRRSPNRHTPVPGASERGYLFGGMDFIDHTRDQQSFNADDDYHFWIERQSRKDQHKPVEPSEQQFGVEYNQNSQGDNEITHDENYQGYTAQYPRKVWQYAADPSLPCNTYITEVVETVDPVCLVGDTLANHRIPKERPLTEEEKSYLCTEFSSTPGFTVEHRTVRQEIREPEPICFSVSAKKHLARTDGNYSPPRSQSVGATRQSTTGAQPLHRKQVSVNSLNDSAVEQQTNPNQTSHWTPDSDLKGERWQAESEQTNHFNRQSSGQTRLPSWSDHVQQRRNLWERKSRQMDEWVGRPANYKVCSERPAFESKRADGVQNVWQMTRDHGSLQHPSSHEAAYARNEEENWRIQNGGQQNSAVFNSQSNQKSSSGNQRTFGNNRTQQQLQEEAGGGVVGCQAPYEHADDHVSVNRQATSQFNEQATHTRPMEQPQSQTPPEMQFLSQENQRISHRSAYQLPPQRSYQSPAQQYQDFEQEKAHRPQVHFERQTGPTHQTPVQQSKFPVFDFQRQTGGTFPRPSWQQSTAQKQPPPVPAKPQRNSWSQQSADDQQQIMTSERRDYNRFYHKGTPEEEETRVVYYSTQNPADFDHYIQMNGNPGQVFKKFANDDWDHNKFDGQNVTHQREWTTKTVNDQSSSSAI